MSDIQQLNGYRESIAILTKKIWALDATHEYGAIYNTYVKDRRRTFLSYKDLYAKYLQKAYGELWKGELAKRYKEYRAAYKLMPDSWEKWCFRIEIRAINQLTLDYGLRKKTKRYKRPSSTNHWWPMELHQYTEWAQGEHDEAERQSMLNQLYSFMDKLTPVQKVYATEVWINGKKITQVAEMYNVNKSSVSRLVTKARNAMQREITLANKNFRREFEDQLDLSIDAVYIDLTHVLSAYQRLLLVLRMHDHMTLEELGEILHRNKSTMNRNMKRIVARILDYSHTEHVTILHFERLVRDTERFWNKIMDEGDIYEYIKQEPPVTRAHYVYLDPWSIDLNAKPLKLRYDEKPKRTRFGYRLANYHLTTQVDV